MKKVKQQTDDYALIAKEKALEFAKDTKEVTAKSKSFFVKSFKN